jgi:hypothetical protein
VIYQVWAGPVSAAQVKGADLPGAEVRFIPCTGDGKPQTCGDMAAAWKDSDGRILPNLLAKVKIPPLTDQDELWAGAFSAGGQIWKRVMMAAPDRAQITGAIMSDGGYEAGWVNEHDKIAPFVEGFVLYALDCIADGRLFVWTASNTANVSTLHPGTVYPAGDQVQDATRAEIEKRSGLTFEDVTDRQELWPWGAHLRAPAHVWRLRNVIFADYGGAYKHPEHATILAAEVWQSIPQILASGAQPDAGGATSTAGKVGLIALGLAVLGGGALLALRRRKP